MIEKSHLTPPKMNDDPKKGTHFKRKGKSSSSPIFFSRGIAYQLPMISFSCAKTVGFRKVLYLPKEKGDPVTPPGATQKLMTKSSDLAILMTRLGVLDIFRVQATPFGLFSKLSSYMTLNWLVHFKFLYNDFIILSILSNITWVVPPPSNSGK